MPKFELLHLQRPEGERETPEFDKFFDAMMGSPSAAVSEGMYAHVATPECETIDEIYRLTNSFEEPWFENEAAGALVAPLRSLMVGDIVRNEEGDFYACLPVGWGQIEDTHGRLAACIEVEEPTPGLIP